MLHKYSGMLAGSPEKTRALITFKAENEAKFEKSKSAVRPLWEKLLGELGLGGKVTAQQAAKKWENLKKKYRDLRTPKTGQGTDGGEETAATWQFFEEMHEVLGGRPYVDPPLLVVSFPLPDGLQNLHAGQYALPYGLSVANMQFDVLFDYNLFYYPHHPFDCRTLLEEMHPLQHHGFVTVYLWLEMHEVLGGRPYVDPPLLVVSFPLPDGLQNLHAGQYALPYGLSVANMQFDVLFDYNLFYYPHHPFDCRTLLEEMHPLQHHGFVTVYLWLEMPSTSASTSASVSATTPTTPTPEMPPIFSSLASSPSGPSPKKQKTSISIIEFLKEESEKEQKRFDASEEKTDRLLSLFEKMVDKM